MSHDTVITHLTVRKLNIDNEILEELYVNFDCSPSTNGAASVAAIFAEKMRLVKGFKETYLIASIMRILKTNEKKLGMFHLTVSDVKPHGECLIVTCTPDIPQLAAVYDLTSTDGRNYARYPHIQTMPHTPISNEVLNQGFTHMIFHDNKGDVIVEFFPRALTESRCDRLKDAFDAYMKPYREGKRDADDTFSELYHLVNGCMSAQFHETMGRQFGYTKQIVVEKPIGNAYHVVVDNKTFTLKHCYSPYSDVTYANKKN